MSFSITQGLPAELREQLEEEAARLGQEPDTLVVRFLREALQHHGGQSFLTGITVTDLGRLPLPDRYDQEQTQAAADEKAERFRRWADSQPRRGVPVIPLEALDREHIYGDHA